MNPIRSIASWLFTSVMLASFAFAHNPLPAWNDAATKTAIMDFVERVTAEESADFVPIPDRIATFDNDGNLWAEQPVYFN